MPETKPKRGNKNETINRIINTTLKMIEEDGYANTTTNQIADRASVSIALIYKYFPNGKQDILKEVAGRVFEDFNQYRIETIHTDDYEETLRKILTEMMRSHRKYEPIMDAIAIAMLSNKQLFNEAFQMERGEKILTPLFMEILRNSQYNKGNIEEKNRMLIYTIDGLIHRQILYNDVADSDEKIVTFLIELVSAFLNKVD